MKRFLGTIFSCVMLSLLWSNGSFGQGSFEQRETKVGDKANYKVDTDSARTCQLVRGGKYVLEVTKILPDQSPSAYEIRVDYDLKLAPPLGRTIGVKNTQLPTEYFTIDLWNRVRKGGEYVGQGFKMKHEGYVDALMPDGHIYEHCDKVYIYDMEDITIETTTGTYILKNATIHALVREEIPVLGAVKMDISGNIDGFDFTMGLDYVPTPK